METFWFGLPGLSYEMVVKRISCHVVYRRWIVQRSFDVCLVNFVVFLIIWM